MLRSVADDPPMDEDSRMLVMDCPWCDDSMVVDDASAATGACATCGIVVEFAPDPVGAPIAALSLAA